MTRHSRVSGQGPNPKGVSPGFGFRVQGLGFDPLQDRAEFAVDFMALEALEDRREVLVFDADADEAAAETHGWVVEDELDNLPGIGFRV